MADTPVNNIAIMQSRLTPPKGRGIQFFPFDEWENEFSIAKQLGISGIEFVFPFHRFEDTPLWSDEGRQKLRRITHESGVSVHAVSADYFVEAPFFSSDKLVASKSEDILFKLIENCSLAKIDALEIPILDRAVPKDDVERQHLVDVLKKADKKAIRLGVSLDLEIEKSAEYTLALLDEVDSKNIKVVYDTGNAIALGFDIERELEILSGRLHNIHIKNRNEKMGSIPLDNSLINFASIFKKIREINYTGWITLQVARGSDATETKTVSEQISFIKKYMV